MTTPDPREPVPSTPREQAPKQAVLAEILAAGGGNLPGELAALAADAGPFAADVARALHLAEHLQRQAEQLQTPQERRQQVELDQMIQNPHDKVTLTQLTDQAFRSRVPQRAVDQLVHILDVQGIPRFFSPIDRTLLKGFQSFGSYLPGVAVPLVKEKMQQETANVILPAEPKMLARHLLARGREGLRMNVNYLGEALLGEDEAQRRLESYLQSLQMAEIEVISVKISTLYSQISSLAREETLAVLCDRLELLYRAAAKERFTRPDGTQVPKFVYLDMEEYRDLELTVEAFIRTLSRPGLAGVSAGIALQAYIPDSLSQQRRLNAWARGRVAAGGAPITIRLVKGANMEMERVEASLRDWPLATFPTKQATDANYKRMLHEGLQGETIRAVTLGVASHNLFEVAYAMVLAAERNCLDQIQFEMLEGMANHQRRALFQVADNLLLYAPACRKEDFVHAIGYLVRRLDENTGPENFLRHAFQLKVNSPQWKQLQRAFVESFATVEHAAEPRRTQDRRQPPARPDLPADWRELENEPDTDFSLASNVQWAEEILRRWETRCGSEAVQIPVVVAGEELWEGREVRDAWDPSRGPACIVAHSRQATSDDVRRAVACAHDDPSGWRQRPVAERQGVLAEVAQQVRIRRGDLLGAMLADGGKLLTEGDPEVSEAIDFLEFYGRAAVDLSSQPGLRAEGLGVVVVVSPWNFPCAIPCGGVAAALAAGNTVILKPASDAILPAWELCQCFWRGGVPREALQFLPCPGAGPGAELVSHPQVSAVILTGGTETALRMLAAKHDMNLSAETGGKNATIVTALADRDQAIKNIIHSAFSHSGQKCSATSLLILEDEVYRDAGFRHSLCDAVESLAVGSAWDLKSKLGPLIRPPSGDLERALKELEHDESWALMPRRRNSDTLYSPGIKWGVQPGSYTHMTEFFGPVLAVIRARDLDEAIAIANQTGYGLTAGLESLDDREQQLWRDAIRAGNLYINRGTTGAVVLRQPFGGVGKSAFGPGIKAGGPNYVAPLMRFEDTARGSAGATAADTAPEELAAASERRWQALGERVRDRHLADLLPRLPQLARQREAAIGDGLERLAAAVASYADYYDQEFGRAHDHFQLVGQDNLRRYLPVAELRIRVDPRDSLFEIFGRVCAARIAGCRITVSAPPDRDAPLVDLLDQWTTSWGGAIEFVDEDDEQLAEVVRQRQTDRVRFAAAERVPEPVFGAAAASGVFLARAPVLMHGRVELLWYVTEQSISNNYHRYGNLGERAAEPRRPVK